jgi:alkylation response protein AidB-like acyl-CoA dehydrogenase
MPIGITEDHEHLRTAVRRFVDDRIAPGVLREALEAKTESRPGFWDALRGPGWIGLHVGEQHGGSGVGLVEQAVVVEELGRACAPGAYVPTAIVAAILGANGGGVADALLPRLVSGELTGAVAFDGADLVAGGAAADVIVCALDDGWYVLDASDIGTHEAKSIDLSRRLARIDLDAAKVAANAHPDRKLANLGADDVRLLAATLFAAEAVGVAQWCVDTAAEYAKVRVQFGRPIGQFQGVKHRCAEMLARVELARAAVWDAAAAADDLADPGATLAIAAAASLAFDAVFSNAKDCVQTLGGIGFTWEHDAHIYLRRAMTLHQLTGTPDDWRVRAAQSAMAGARRRLAVDLPNHSDADGAAGGRDIDAFRAELRTLVSEISALPAPEQRVRLAEAGYVTPGWPSPWGRDAKALELLVIEEEFRAAKVPKPNIGVGAWALPNLIVHGTEAQRERWIMPTLRGEIGWCQLFSEPGAGSDLAALSTRATRIEGGWLLNGQKVWTSMAKEADWGICLARTNPEAAKHDGISCFMVDMKTPGIDIRPLRELTGMAMFNEVFFDDCFVPDDCLVGQEHDGWRAARTTLANERVFMGSGNTIGGGVVGVLKAIEARGQADDRLALAEAGGLVATGHALSAMGFRMTLVALAGADPSGSEAAVRKLLGVQHDQHVQEVGMVVTGIEATTTDGDASAWSASFLFNRCLTIAGGTSDIQRNVIAERLLGLPRDP